MDAFAAAPRSFAAVTTCHAAGFELYGRRMVETYLTGWPKNVPLHVYTEGYTLAPQLADQVVETDLIEASPNLAAFKHRHCDDAYARGRSRLPRLNPRFGLRRPGGGIDVRPWRKVLGYRWDAVTFAHKVFAVAHAARRCTADVLVWIDADTHCFADVTADRLESFVPRDCFVGYLARDGTHSECGFVAYNLRHPATRRVLADLEAMYIRDLLFEEDEFHDSYLFDVVRRRQEARGHRSHDIGRGIGRTAEHVLVNSSLGEFMDHMKGDRKAVGASRAADLVFARPEGYWTTVS